MPKKKKLNHADEVMIKLEGFLQAHRAEIFIEEQGTSIVIKCGDVVSERLCFPAITSHTVPRWKNKKWDKPIK